MQQRSVGFSIGVTLCILVFLVLVGSVIRMRSRALPPSQPTVSNVVPLPIPGDVVDEIAPVASASQNDPYEVLVGCELVENRANEGDTIRLRHRGTEHVFHLSAIETPEISGSYPEKLDDDRKYYGHLNIDEIVQVGSEARDYTLGLLSKRPFKVFTKWEKVLQTHRYHAYIWVEHRPGDERFLSELLVRRGLAKIRPQSRKLPNGATPAQYSRHLAAVESYARRERLGGWRTREA